jgi:hypothetical protein
VVDYLKNLNCVDIKLKNQHLEVRDTRKKYKEILELSLIQGLETFIEML